MVNDFNGVPIPKTASFDEYLAGHPARPKRVVNAQKWIGAQSLPGNQPRSLEEIMKNHYCGVECNDESIGKLVAVLEQKGIMDDTDGLWGFDHVLSGGVGFTKDI